MTSIIKLHVISGGADSETPQCYILQVDELRLLLDAGMEINQNTVNFLKEIKKYVHTVDAVLLSYSDPNHLGALPYLVGKLNLGCQIYATIPTFKFGQMFMYDMFMSHYNQYDFDLFSLDDVDAAFDRITQLKYNQSVSLKGKGYGITITPLPGGRMIGGTIWKIVKVGEEEIVYATDFNHKKERHLNGCELERLQRPSLLICDSYNAKYQQARRRARDEKLMTNILQTLRNNGNVLIAVDTAGRVLELAHMLDQLWKNKDSGLMAYSLAFLSNVSYNVIEFAKSQIEWMSDKLMKSFEGARNNPFSFKHLRLLHTMNELSKIPGPKVVLASCPDLESGFSRELFLQWSHNPHNSIILTTRTSQGTLARDLIDNGGNRKIELDIKRRIELEGAELEEYMRTHEGDKHRPTILKREKEEESSSDSDDDDIEMKVITGKHDIVVRPEGRTHSGFFKSSKKQFAMFPLHEEKMKFDDYGEVIQPDDYRIADASGEMQDDNKENHLIKAEDIKKEKDDEFLPIEKPTKCINSRKIIDIKAQVQYIDFEGRSDGESLMKILSQLRPRRVVVVRGNESSSQAVANHCEQTIGAKVFTPRRGETIDATTESSIYQVRLTEALVSELEFQKGKDAEIAWINGQITIRNKLIDNTGLSAMDDEDHIEITGDDNRVIALNPLTSEKILPHDFVFLNELKLAAFKEILMKNNITSEISGGMLLCCNGTIAVKRIDTGKVTIEGCLSEEYYKVRELLYEQYAIV